MDKPKSQLKYLNIKGIIQEEGSCSVKVIHYQDPDWENKVKVRDLLHLPPQKEFVGERINLHYLGEKEEKRAFLVRCLHPNVCEICDLDSKPFFTKMFFYGIHQNEIVFFSISQKAGFDITRAIESTKNEAISLKNPILVKFRITDTARPGISIVGFDVLVKDKSYKYNKDLSEEIQKLDTLKDFLRSKYPETWPQTVYDRIKDIYGK
jgi:hypothetical protein